MEKDIQQDVTDLASVISFLVDNDFLANTELQIGRALEENLIQPISTSKNQIQASADPEILGSNDSDDRETDEDVDIESDDDDDSSDEDNDSSDDDQASAITPDSTVLDEALVSTMVDHDNLVKDAMNKCVDATLACVDSAVIQVEEVDHWPDEDSA